MKFIGVFISAVLIVISLQFAKATTVHKLAEKPFLQIKLPPPHHPPLRRPHHPPMRHHSRRKLPHIRLHLPPPPPHPHLPAPPRP